MNPTIPHTHSEASEAPSKVYSGEPSKVCAVVLLTATELKALRELLTASRGARVWTPFEIPTGIWILEKFLSAPEWCLLYRIVELGGQVAIVSTLPSSDSASNGSSSAPNGTDSNTRHKRIYLRPDRLPPALTPIHIEETMYPIGSENEQAKKPTQSKHHPKP